jgi:hypothetical protein
VALMSAVCNGDNIKVEELLHKMDAQSLFKVYSIPGKLFRGNFNTPCYKIGNVLHAAISHGKQSTAELLAKHPKCANLFNMRSREYGV